MVEESDDSMMDEGNGVKGLGQLDDYFGYAPLHLPYNKKIEENEMVE